MRLRSFRAGLGAALMLALLPVAPVTPRADGAASEIRAALARWTEDFNTRRADKVCDLFAKDARADVAGAPERDYAAICEVLTRSLQDETRRYHYAMDIKEILTFGDTAIVRLVWTLTIEQPDGSKATSVEPGMDLFQKQPDGSWKIIRYMAYER